MTHYLTRFTQSLVLSAAVLLTSTALPGLQGTALAQYPEKPIKVIVPFKPGGRTDTVARLLGKKIEEQKLLSQPLVIVNVPGGGGGIGGRQALDADPDGYTIVHWHHQMLIANAMDIVDFGPQDWQSIGYAGGGSPVWTVRNDIGIDTLADLVDKLHAEPRSLVEVVGIGTIPHFVGALLAQAAGFETRYVQAGSGADRLKMIAGGNADISLFSASEYAKWETAGRGLHAVVFFGPNRIDTIPDVPTAKELGYDVTWANPNWWLAPKGTPQDRIDMLAKALQTAMMDEEIQQYFKENSLDPYWISGPEADADAAAMLEQLKKVAGSIK